MKFNMKTEYLAYASILYIKEFARNLLGVREFVHNMYMSVSICISLFACQYRLYIYNEIITAWMKVLHFTKHW